MGIFFNRPSPVIDAFLGPGPSVDDATDAALTFSMESEANYTTSSGGIRKLRARPPSAAPPVQEQPKPVYLEQTIGEALDEVRRETADGYHTVTFG